MERVILGIDPGQRTGVALVRVGPRAPFRVLQAGSMASRNFPNWLRHVTQHYHPDGAAIEDWTWYAGKRGRKGAAQAAYECGKVIGILLAFGVERYVEVTRPAVLASLGLRSNAPKSSCMNAVQSLTDVAEGQNDHVYDAVATAIAGAGRFTELLEDRLAKAKA